MKKLNSKGFTLIELLAVITILGILMLVAIPAISRTIENSRKSTFLDTAKLYVDAVTTSVSAGEVFCGGDEISSKTDDTYYVLFCSGARKQANLPSGVNCNSDLMQTGGKSSWGNADVYGYVAVQKSGTGALVKYKYYVAMTDGTHGVTSFADAAHPVLSENLQRADVGALTTADVKVTGTNVDVPLCVVS